MVKLEYTVLNAFTTYPKSGNPAAVIILPPPTNINKDDLFSAYPPTTALQAVATKLDYPMTAFLLPLDPNEGKYALRWIDPGTEVQLCGHATVALSEYLFSLPKSPKRLELETVKHGLVVSQRLSNPLKESDERVALDFPEILGFRDIEKSTEEWSDIVKRLQEVTGKAMPIAQLRRNDHYLIVEFAAGFDMSAGGLPLNMDKLSNFEGLTVLLTQPAPAALSRDGPHIHTRVLHALAGKKTEDAATGSAHCALVPHYLTSAAHQSTFHHDVYSLQSVSVKQQSVEGGEMVVQWLKDRKKVRIFGNAVKVGQGEVELDL